MRGSRCDGARAVRLRDEQQRACAVYPFALIALIAGFIRQRTLFRFCGLKWLDIDFAGGQGRKRRSGRH